MDRLETLVRAALAERADHAPAADGLLQAVEHRPRRLLAALTAAAVVIAVAVGVVVFRPNTRHTTSAAPDVPASYHVIAYRGITLAIPDGLPIITDSCTRLPGRYVFAPDGVLHGCPMAISPPGPIEHILTVSLAQAAGKSREIATHPTTVHGLTGRIGYGHLRHFPGRAGVLILPGLHVTITATAPSESTVAAILGSVRAGPDPHGCAQHLDSPWYQPSNPQTALIVPGHPVAAALCVYAPSHVINGASDLIASSRLAAEAGAAIVRLVDELPTAPADQLDRLRPVPQYVLAFRYPDKSTRAVLYGMDTHGAAFTDGNLITTGPGAVRVIDRIARASY